jgi:hypothetical protein
MQGGPSFLHHPSFLYFLSFTYRFRLCCYMASPGLSLLVLFLQLDLHPRPLLPRSSFFSRVYKGRAILIFKHSKLTEQTDAARLYSR